MTRVGKFIYNGILLTLVGIAMRSVQLFLGAFISRSVGVANIGIYTLIMTVYSFALTFSSSGISLTLTKHVASSMAEREGSSTVGIIKGGILYALFFGFLGCSSLLLLSDVLAVRIVLNAEASRSLCILAFSLLPQALSSVFYGYFIGVRRVFFSAAIQVLSQVFRVAFTVIALSAIARSKGTLAIEMLCIGTFLCELICFVISLSLFLVDRFIYLRGKRGKADVPSIVKMAVPLWLSAIVRSALLTLEHSFIPKGLMKRGNSKDKSMSSYGILHGMALPIILYPMTPLTSFSGLLVPEFAEADSAGLGKRISRITAGALTRTLCYGILCSVFLNVFSEELGYILYHSYDVGYYVSILSVVIPIMYLDHVTDSILKGIGEHIFSMWVNIADAFLSVVLVYFLVPVFDIMGYALVIIIMELFNFTLSYIRLRSKIRFKLDFVRGLIIPLASSLVCTLALKYMFSVNGNATSPIVLSVKLVVSICLFVALEIIAESLILPRISPRGRRTEA